MVIERELRRGIAEYGVAFFTGALARTTGELTSMKILMADLAVFEFYTFK
jgi:hypothetical protein